MRLEAALDSLHARAVRSLWLRLLSAQTRGLLAVGFIFPSLPKVRGVRFTSIPTSHPVGAFFEAFFQAEAYYAFVGAAQLLAGLLLLLPRTATLGAVLYFPIILNIFVITVSIDFKGTPLIAGLMLVGSTFLLCWDYDRWKALLPGFGPAARPPEPGRHAGLGLTLLAGAVAGLGGLGLVGLGIALLEHKGLLLPALLFTAGVAVNLALARAYLRAQRRAQGASTAPGTVPL